MKTKFFEKLLSSLDNHSTGFSGRKISAAIAVLCSVYLSVKNTDHDNVIYVIITWLAFAGICLGIVTVEQVIRLKNGDNTTNNNNANGAAKEAPQQA